MNKKCYLFKKNGELLDTFVLLEEGKVNSIEWDKDGDYIAILQENAVNITLYEISTKKATQISLNNNNASFITWSKTGPQLAIGTTKGNLFIYNKITRKRVPIMGKHSKKITCGCWNIDNKLALSGPDQMITISDSDGNTLDQTVVKKEPFKLDFAEQKTDTISRLTAQTTAASNSTQKKTLLSKENTVSVNSAGETILLHRLNDPDNPVELAFQAKYGTIKHYHWYGDGYMLIAFSEGYVVAISTHMEEIGEELQSLRLHESTINDLIYCDALNKCATISENQIKIVDLSMDWKQQQEVKTEILSYSQNDGKPYMLDWTSDGQILSVATSNGNVFNYLMSMPLLCSGYLDKVAYLSSLREVTVVDIKNKEPTQISRVPLAVEPSILSICPCQIAIAMNNSVWVYQYSTE